MSATPSDKTLDTVIDTLATLDRTKLVAIVRCARVESFAPGTRSERTLHHAEVLATLNGAPPAPLVLNGAYGKECLMTPGKTYLVIAFELPDWAPERTIETAIELREGEIDAVARRARAKLASS